MIYIFWSLLNLFLAAGFLVICFNAVKLIKIRYGRLITFIFLIGLLSFICTPKEDRDFKRPMHTLKFHKNLSSINFQESLNTWHMPDSMAQYYMLKNSDVIVVHKNPLFKISLHVSYGTEVSTGKVEPVYAYTSYEGFHSGVDWNPIAPLVNIDQSGKKIDFEVHGEMKWMLLNLGLYSEGKTFSGSFAISK